MRKSYSRVVSKLIIKGYIIEILVYFLWQKICSIKVKGKDTSLSIVITLFVLKEKISHSAQQMKI